MLYAHNQNWRTSQLPFSLTLANTLNTGVSFSTPSGSVAESQRWATRGMQGLGQGHGFFGRGVQGYGPRVQYGRGAGMDGHGDCGCGCGGSCGCGDNGGGVGLMCVAAAIGLYFLLGSPWRQRFGES